MQRCVCVRRQGKGRGDRVRWDAGQSWALSALSLCYLVAAGQERWRQNLVEQIPQPHLRLEPRNLQVQQMPWEILT